MGVLALCNYRGLGSCVPPALVYALLACSRYVNGCGTGRAGPVSQGVDPRGVVCCEKAYPPPQGKPRMGLMMWRIPSRRPLPLTPYLCKPSACQLHLT